MTEQLLLNLNKKALIISSWAPPQIGGAQNLYNLFIDINPENYCLLTNEKSLDDLKRGGPKLNCQYYFFETYRNKFKKIYQAIKIGRQIIKNENIEMIMAISDGGFSFYITYILAKITKTPYSIFLFDLWKGNIFAINSKLIIFFEPILFRNAKKIIVTNDTTKEYYRETYKNEDKLEIIYNSTSPKGYEDAILAERFDDNKKIVYTGNIYWPQKESLINLIDVVANNENLNLTLDIYCPIIPDEIISKYKNNSCINFLYAAPSEMPRIQGEADILFLPFSWDTPAPDIIRTASPGKLTDYLIAGKPILIYAPNYSFIARYAKQNKFAEVIDTPDKELLIQGIKKLLSDKEYRDNLVVNAKKTFYKNHDSHINAEKLTNIINNI
jgi:glycosyltransferase involved in cell wall biosynthesis